MNRKLAATLVAMVVLAAAYLPALPKVAVLDAQIPATMDKSVVVPITDKIAEELVHSNQYSVLDRANIEQVLKEKEFQVSGMVQDSDIKQAGKYLGADFVVVARVSLVESTYFISAKMINVESGAVTAQVSDQEEGKTAVLLTIAERVGKKLVGGVIEPEKAPTATAGTSTTAGAKGGQAAATGKRTLQPTITVEAGLPLYLGDFATAANDHVTYYVGSDTKGALSISGRFAYYIANLLYVGASAGYAYQTSTWSGTSGNVTETTFTVLDLAASVGVGFPIGTSLQIYAGAKVGLASETLGNFWIFTFGDYSGVSAAGLAYGLEAGVDLILLKFITVGARLEWLETSIGDQSGIQTTAGFFSSSYTSPYSFGTVRVIVGAGIALGGKK